MISFTPLMQCNDFLYLKNSQIELIEISSDGHHHDYIPVSAEVCNLQSSA